MNDAVRPRWTSEEAPIAVYGVIGSDVARVEGREKVTGAALYGGDQAPEGLTHAALAVSTIAQGRVKAIDLRPAEAVPGVLMILRAAPPRASARRKGAPRRQPATTKRRRG